MKQISVTLHGLGASVGPVLQQAMQGTKGTTATVTPVEDDHTRLDVTCPDAAVPELLALLDEVSTFQAAPPSVTDVNDAA
ncbi:hypothetical protein IGB42_01872 [Andreprevotia sp. IGB-42]|uniref:hypothetical protein n=1 Tax=Andreprevotia sp. IGB-42 TaxID=2497473 RepID=UPI0013575644|nr:hypothetical protein [Andreprevotia sp. IGB-42]KAF0813521.1 hypothetical protein IGB42_01872 [Andreprevotia sp. IGB-42]